MVFPMTLNEFSKQQKGTTPKWKSHYLQLNFISFFFKIIYLYSTYLKTEEKDIESLKDLNKLRKAHFLCSVEPNVSY